jgi:hypothetical protein
VRLGLLGPAGGDLAALARAAEFLLNGAEVNRAIYLGGDDALEDAVGVWAESLVGSDATDEGVWMRALPVIRGGTAERIDSFLRSERARLRLKSLESLPPNELRSVEMFGDRLAVLIHDKSLLDEEDIFSATFLVYGKSEAPLVKKIGGRWFLTPGPIGKPGGGAVVLDDATEQIVATVYDAEGRLAHTEVMATESAAKLVVR